MKLINTAVIGASASASPLLTNLVAYWALENVNDSHTNGYTLTNNNSATFTSGKVNNAGTFVRASSQYLSRADNTDLRITGNYTVALWVNPTVVNVLQNTLWKSTGGTGGYGMLFNSAQIDWQIANGAGFTNLSAAGALTAGAWHFILVTYDGTTCTMYVNNSSVASGLRPALIGEANPLQVGADVTNSRYFGGQIDELGIWSRVLTSDERTQLYNSGNGVTYPTFV